MRLITHSIFNLVEGQRRADIFLGAVDSLDYQAHPVAAPHNSLNRSGMSLAFIVNLSVSTLRARPVNSGVRLLCYMNLERIEQMENLLMLSVFLLFLPVPTFAQEANKSEEKATEEKAVRQTIQYYFQGYSNMDILMMSKAFHPQAKHFVVEYGELEEIPQSLVQQNMAIYPQPDPNPDTAPKRIISVDITGEVAAAKVEMDYDNGRFTEYLSLLKFQGEWKIVSKVATAGLRCIESKKPQGTVAP